MKYTIKKLENKNIEIEMTLTNVEWENELNDAYNKNKFRFWIYVNHFFFFLIKKLVF